MLKRLNQLDLIHNDEKKEFFKLFKNEILKLLQNNKKKIR